MQAQAVTYRTGESAGNLRTVIVQGAHRSVVLLPAGRLEVMTGKLLRGRTDRADWWAEVLGTEGTDDFAVLAEQVTQVKDIGPIKIKRECK